MTKKLFALIMIVLLGIGFTGIFLLATGNALGIPLLMILPIFMYNFSKPRFRKYHTWK